MNMPLIDEASQVYYYRKPSVEQEGRGAEKRDGKTILKNGQAQILQHQEGRGGLCCWKTQYYHNVFLLLISSDRFDSYLTMAAKILNQMLLAMYFLVLNCDSIGIRDRNMLSQNF